MEDYPRHLIFGTMEHTRFEQDGWKYGWFVTPSLLKIVKQKLCYHNYTLWCTNQGVKDVFPTQIRCCKKCGKRQQVYSWD